MTEPPSDAALSLLSSLTHQIIFPSTTVEFISFYDNYLFHKFSSTPLTLTFLSLYIFTQAASFPSSLIFSSFTLLTPLSTILLIATFILSSLLNIFVLLYVYFILQKASYLPSFPSLSIPHIFHISNLLILLFPVACCTQFFAVLSMNSSTNLDSELFHQINSNTALLVFTLFAPFIFKCHHNWSVILASTSIFFSSLIASTLSSTPPQLSNFLTIIQVLLILQAVTVYHASCQSKEDYEQQQSALQSMAQLQSEGHIITKKYEEIKYLLGNVTHDLKSPLQAFQMELDSMRQGFEDTLRSTTKEQTPPNQSINSIFLLESLCDFMLIMINRTLDYTKTASGMKLVPSHQTMDLFDMIAWVKQLSLRSSHPIPIEIESLPEDICSHIITDPQWFKENLLCLVSNAQKFSPDGVIKIRCLISSDDSEMIRVEVEDGGIGISEEKIGQLFQPFQQAQLMAGGTGLGLFSLSKRIECLGGSCGVKKREDGQSGSCFWFTMHYRPDDEASMLASNHSQEEEKESKPSTRDISELKLNILIVEDSPLIQKTTTRSLKKLGHNVDIANNGLDCMKLMNLSPGSSPFPSSPCSQYDVILMDLHMPIMDGLEATRRIRELENLSEDKDLRKQLIIGLSANSDLETTEKALSVGMNDFIAKPLKVSELNSCLQRLIGE